MKQLIAAGMTVLLLLVGLLLPTAPALASSDGTMGDPPDSFHAFSKMSSMDRDALRLMTDDELATVEGAARWRFPILWSNANFGIILQINICAICANVTQGNAATLIQRGRR